MVLPISLSSLNVDRFLTPRELSNIRQPRHLWEGSMNNHNTNPIFRFWFTSQMTRASNIPQGGGGSEVGGWIPAPLLASPEGGSLGPIWFQPISFRKMLFLNLFSEPLPPYRGKTKLGNSHNFAYFSHHFNFFGVFSSQRQPQKWICGKWLLCFRFFYFQKRQNLTKYSRFFPIEKLDTYISFHSTRASINVFLGRRGMS